MVCSALYSSNLSQMTWTEAAVALMTEHGEADHRREFDSHNETVRQQNIDRYGLVRGNRDDEQWKLNVRQQFARWTRDLLTPATANA